MFHHCNHPIRFGHFEHLELSRRCIVTWHLLAANSKLVENFEPSSEYSLWCWQQRKSVSEYSALNLDKNKSVVSRFSVFVFDKSAVSTVQKSNYVGCFNFR